MKSDSFYKNLSSFSVKIKQISNPITFTLGLAFVIMALLVLESWDFYFSKNEEFRIQILAELHGLVLDIVVLGILIVWINRITERRKTVEMCKLQIEDLRTLRGENVGLMHLTCIKTLNRNGVYDIDLRRVSIPDAPLTNVRLECANLSELECPRARFVNASFRHSTLHGCNMEGAELYNSDLSFVSANIANFSDCNLSKANLTNGKFIATKFNKAYLNGASFAGSNLLQADFDGAHLVNVDFRGCKELTVKQLNAAKALIQCLFDEELNNVFNRKPNKDATSTIRADESSFQPQLP